MTLETFIYDSIISPTFVHCVFAVTFGWIAFGQWKYATWNLIYFIFYHGYLAYWYGTVNAEEVITATFTPTILLIAAWLFGEMLAMVNLTEKSPLHKEA